ncbi:MAG: hypothetical protein ACJ79H_23105, partial [Myxococcales bacterium]
MRFAVLALLLASAAARAQSRAPLGARTQGPLRELFLDVTSADARRLPSPELDVRYTLANTWNEPMALVSGPHVSAQELDEQADSIAVRVRLPWSRALGPAYARFSTAVETRAVMHWGGYTDRPIEAWHSVSGAFNFRREDYPRNQLHLVFADDGGRAFALDGGPSFALGDLVLR